MTDMEIESDDKQTTGLLVLDCLINYLLFAPLTLLFWYGVGIFFQLLVIDGEISLLPRTLVVMAVATSLLTYFAYDQDRLQEMSENVLRDFGYKHYFLFTRTHFFLMGFSDVILFVSMQTLYTEYVGPEVGPMVHATWAVNFLVIMLAMKFSRTIVCSPYYVYLDEDLESNWFAFSLYFKTTRADYFVLRLFDATFTAWFIPLIMNSFWFTATFTFDGLVYPSDFVKSMVVSIVSGYAIIGLAKCLTPLAVKTSVAMERDGRMFDKLVLEDALIFVATIGDVLCWKGLTMFSQLLCETLAPIFGVSSDVIAVVGIFVVFFVMAALGVSYQLIYNGPGTDGKETMGKGLIFPTRYFAPHPHTS